MTKCKTEQSQSDLWDNLNKLIRYVNFKHKKVESAEANYAKRNCPEIFSYLMKSVYLIYIYTMDPRNSVTQKERRK